MRLVGLAAVVTAVTGGYVVLAAPGAFGDAGMQTARTPVEPCATLMSLSLPDGGHVTSAADEPAANGLPAYCSVSITVTDTSDDRGLPGDTNIFLTLPDNNWNGSFMAEGGGVYAGTASPPTDQLAAGYAASTTDTGHQEDPLSSEWVIDPLGSTDGSDGINWNRVNDFGYLSLHFDAVESKAVIDAYYGLEPKFSFWNGCSTGGRQGLSEAQKYPTDFNGILAGAPALDWTKFIPSELWPELVMQWNGDNLPPCKEAAVNNALASHCPDQDGQIDGVFDPRTCDVLAILKSLIGTSTPCGTFTTTDAKVVEEIWQGPTDSGLQSDLLHGQRVWLGLEPGTDMGSIPGATLGGTVGPNNGIGPQEPVPFYVPVDWLRNWVHRDQTWQWQSETAPQYFQDIKTSTSLYSYALDADNPDLSAFRDAGGKLVIWQGLADQLIFTGDSINYYNQVLHAMGGVNATEKFARYFLAPGVSHCGTPGAGSVAPTDPMQSVVDWVEKGQVPQTLPASGTINGASVTRPLCPYPDPDATYVGGDPAVASSYRCRSIVQLTNPWVTGTSTSSAKRGRAPTAIARQ
ncbi:MAG: tannase/feruloyl esterase family alpha/beta hydrolase [Actinobacteria bacterium]|nr:tannase/feruloyl esterase family alpha/beta hydrolase [Actinomycetota bacterium]